MRIVRSSVLQSSAYNNNNSNSSSNPRYYSSPDSNNYPPYYAYSATNPDPELKIKAIENEQKSVEEKIEALCGKKINVRSAKQVAEVIYANRESIGKTNRETLEHMCMMTNNPLAGHVLQWRKLEASRKRMVQRRDNHTRSIAEKEAKMAQSCIDDDDDPLILVDASGLIFRSYYAMPPTHRLDGTPTGAVMGFCNMLTDLVVHPLLAGKNPRTIMVFDSKGKSFRNDLFPEYKANRGECPIDLVPQFDLIREATRAYGIPAVEAKGYEADDVIATLATKAVDNFGFNVEIVSSDKDLMQLVSHLEEAPTVHMVDPMKKQRVTCTEVIEKWGVEPKLVGDLLALAGDSSDNVPGVPGIGPKTAAVLLQEYGNLDNLLDNTHSIKQKARREKLQQNIEMARISRQLVELHRFVPDEAMNLENTDLASMRVSDLDEDRIFKFIDAMQFNNLKRRMMMKLGKGNTKRRKLKKNSANNMLRYSEIMDDSVPF